MKKQYMSDEAFAGLKAAFREMVDYEQGKRPNLRTTTMALPAAPQPISAEGVTKIRMKLNSSQAMFARILNVSPRTVQDWEQGRRSPGDAALKLLLVAEKHPEVLFDIPERAPIQSTRVAAVPPLRHTALRQITVRKASGRFDRTASARGKSRTARGKSRKKVTRKRS